jgi:hypothetical protein
MIASHADSPRSQIVVDAPWAWVHPAARYRRARVRFVDSKRY